MERLLTVSGSGSFSSDPDVGVVSLRIGVVAATVTAATDAMSENLQATLSALDSSGADEVSTGRFSIRPERDQQGRQRGFRAETAVRAEISMEERSGTRLSAILDHAVRAGGDSLSIDDLEFQVSDPTASRHEAARLAIADARARAEAMAESAGVSVDQVVTIEETDQPSPGPIRLRAVVAEAGPPPVVPGGRTTTVDVRVTFSIS